MKISHDYGIDKATNSVREWHYITTVYDVMLTMFLFSPTTLFMNVAKCRGLRRV